LKFNQTKGPEKGAQKKGAGYVFPLLYRPPLRVIKAGLVLGFPLTCVLAWVFDLTPAGIARTPNSQPGLAGMAGKAVDGCHLGSQSYERKLEGVFAVQIETVQRMAEKPLPEHRHNKLQ
jgi:hypothetical protein